MLAEFEVVAFSTYRRYPAMLLGCRRISTSSSSPILGPVLGTRSLPDRTLVTCKIGLSGAGSVGLYVATGLTF